MAATDFEPINARNAFVLFDEPAMKAIFSIQIVVDSTYTALSNMPEQSSTPLNNGQKVTN